MASVTKIKDSLLKQLQAKGADVDLYRSLVDDYCWMWKQERAMQADIRKKGRTYTAVSAAGKDYEKDNPSVKNALLYSRQMIAILDTLGLSTETVVGGAGDNVDHDLG
ncbi:P27 family phage terminase small subunit [Caproicibacter fermentans]|uniref:P27 family phage terminase small subunit n=1 Tax=Caproicibacter fermentans TaxID=2576756 RepID=A0A7G8TDZ0_9FIRM|nr:P27 family phage terminase small subunit [Caproicibacter fermentans]QNK41831.1 P27 family phage terminase small subunit [Caproicibacter fermentans]